MNRLESWLLHASTILLAATGFVYAWMHYLLKPVDPFSVVNHPFEPYLFSGHVILAPFLVLGFGMILHGHILFKISTGTQTGRRTGLVMIPIFAVMVVSGYLLQIITSDFRKTMVWIHLISGVIWAILYVGHQVSSYRMRNRFRVQAAQILLVALLLCAVANAETADPTVREVESMGTTLRVVSLETDQEKALENTEMVIRAIEETDQQLSTWKEESELSRFNRQGINVPFSASGQLFELLIKLKHWTQMTNGAFDPGIGRLLDAWRVHSGFQIPSQHNVQTAVSESGIGCLVLEAEHHAIMKLRDIHIDPGAFGKGEGLRRAIEIAREHNMAPVLLDFGGQIAVFGEPPEGRAWEVHMADPFIRSQMQAHRLVLKRGSLSTSGFSERSGEVKGKLMNHILDPRTGRPSPLFGSVTVWDNDPLAADVLSTALYVMGPEKGFAWASKNHVAAAFSTEKATRQTREFDAELK